MRWYVYVIVALVAVGAVSAYGFGNDFANGQGYGMMGYGPAQMGAYAGQWYGLYHGQMEEVLDNGTYADLARLREETGMPMMPWVQDEESLSALQGEHAASGDAGREGPTDRGFGGRGARGQGFGCPMFG